MFLNFQSHEGLYCLQVLNTKSNNTLLKKDKQTIVGNIVILCQNMKTKEGLVSSKKEVE